jgi:hypothetical protein
VTARARAPAMACVDGLGRLGRTSAGDSLRCSAARGAVASKPLLGPWKVLRATRRLRECRKRKFSKRMRSPLHWGGADASGRPCPTPGGAICAVLVVLLRNYGFTDLPPSLPLPRSDPVTRIYESSYRRHGWNVSMGPSALDHVNIIAKELPQHAPSKRGRK